MILDPGVLTGIITLILGSGAGARYLLTRRDSKAPIPTATAEAALVTQLMGLSGDTLDDMRTDIKDQRVLLREQRVDLNEALTKIDEQALKLDQMRRLFTVSTTHIEALLRWINYGAKPPPPKLPTILYEVIDPSLHEPDDKQGRL